MMVPILHPDFTEIIITTLIIQMIMFIYTRFDQRLTCIPPIGSLQKFLKWSRWLYNILKFLSLLDSGPRLVESFLVGPTEKTNIVGFRPSSCLQKFFGIQMLAGCCLLDLAYYFIFLFLQATIISTMLINIIIDQSKPKSTFHWSISFLDNI